MQTVLLISFVPPNNAATISDHEESLINQEAYYVRQFNPIGKESFGFDLSRFDVIIIHYSVMIFSDNYFSQNLRNAVSAAQSLKVLFIQDEYRFVRSALDVMIGIGIDVLFTCVPPQAVDGLYGQLRRRGVRIEQTLTGYVPEELTRMVRKPIAGRPLDVVYRGRAVPQILGKLGEEKVFIASRMRELAPQYGLKVDVDWLESARIYGPAWTRFLGSGRTALGTESGASVADLTGDLDRAWRLLEKHALEGTTEPADHHFLDRYEGNIVINTISPRAFEAIALGTALVQFPGHYSGILHEGQHYVALDKDFGNLGAVVDAIRDTNALQAMADRTYEEIVGSGRHSYARFAAEAYAIIAEEWERRVYRHPVPAPQILGPTANAPPAPLPDIGAWHREIQRETVADRTTKGLVNVCLANLGASITASVPFFGQPHDLDYLVREPLEGNYAAATEGFATPQSITVDLGKTVPVERVDVEWYTFDHHPTSVALSVTDGQNRSTMIETQAVHDVHTQFELAGRPVQKIQITVAGFYGQKRMLVRRLQVFETASRYT